MIDFTWVTIFFLPFAVIFALVFSVGIMVFLFYDLVRTKEERRRGGQSPADATRKVGKFTRLSLLRLARGIRRKKAAPSAAPPAEDLVGAEPKGAGAGLGEVAAPPPAPPPASTYNPTSAPTSTPTHALTSTPASVLATAPPPAAAATAKKSAPEGNEVKIRPVQSLSEVSTILGKKEDAPPTSADTASSIAPSPAPAPAPTLAAAASGAANVLVAKSSVDSDDVLALLGEAAVSTDKKGSERGHDPRQELKQEPEGQGQKERSADAGVGTATVGASASAKRGEAALEEQPFSEVASLLKVDEPADKVKELSAQFSELRSSLFELRDRLKKMARNENEVPNRDSLEGA